MLKRDKEDNQLQSAVNVIKGIKIYKNFAVTQGAVDSSLRDALPVETK